MVFFFFKQKTADELRISDWSSYVCSSDLWLPIAVVIAAGIIAALQVGKVSIGLPALRADLGMALGTAGWVMGVFALIGVVGGIPAGAAVSRFGDRRLIVLGLALRSEEHTSELQSLMRTSYAVFCFT